MSLDGALLVAHNLEVLAFGAKLPLSEDTFDVYPVGPDGQKGRPSQQGTRGLRHRAAASFAHRYPEGIALLMSHDGTAAAFLSWENDIVCWPIRLPVFEEF